MASFFQKLFKILNRDLTGKTWDKEVEHHYFASLRYQGHADPSLCYWEAELVIPGRAKSVSTVMDGTPEGPEPAEEEFCRNVVANLDGLFQKCQAAFEPQFATWARRPWPVDWRSEFKLDGFSVPIHGNENGAWDVTYFVESAHHYFTAKFESGQVIGVEVDG